KSCPRNQSFPLAQHPKTRLSAGFGVDTDVAKVISAQQWDPSVQARPPLDESGLSPLPAE
ncbi:hypothetical protein, partial [Rhizobium redzepovicii]|uniref:hypothetical protein n=1 Tax=Rhizobium redzepovicii TaxID=2867518 RepID=UPI00287244D1